MNQPRFLFLPVLLAAIIVMVTACNREKSPIQVNLDQADMIPIQEERSVVRVAIHLPKVDTLTLPAIQKKIAQLLPGFLYINDPAQVPASGEAYTVEFENAAPPRSDLKDLSADDFALLANSFKQTVRFEFLVTKTGAIGKVHGIYDMLYKLAEGEGVSISDGITGEYFDPTAWRSERVQDFDSTNITTQFKVSVFDTDNVCTANTVGLRRFGLPEVHVSGFPCDDDARVHSLIIATAQQLFEKPMIGADTTLTLRIADIQSQTLRKHLQRTAAGSETGEAKLKLRYVNPPNAGDSDTRHLEIIFTGLQEQTQVLNSLFGTTEATAL